LNVVGSRQSSPRMRQPGRATFDAQCRDESVFMHRFQAGPLQAQPDDVWPGRRAELFDKEMNRRLLFICSRNRWRSPTAETVYADHPGVEVDSAGLNHDATVPLSPEQIRWADLILVMEKSHRNRLNRKFGKYLSGKRVVVLDIPDDYGYMDPALVDLINRRCAQYVPKVSNHPFE
jgi:predicted protein tyrosine phosphatase